jgi:signal transduction histidine kinase
LSSAEIPSAGGARRLSLELHALDKSAGAGHFAILKDCGALTPLELELLLASEQRGWDYQRETLMHDLKGILNSMQISLELLSDAEADMAQASSPEGRKQRRIASMKADLTRMDRALRALPGADGVAEPAITNFDVREVLREIFTALRQLVRRSKVELKLDMGDIAVMVRGRRPWIKQALFNVAVHRLNAMRGGGSLAVGASMTDEAVAVTLRNDVPDMRQGLIDESFASFGAVRGNHGANDLRVARFILESQGGTMEVASNGAESTDFVLRLPRKSPIS